MLEGCRILAVHHDAGLNGGTLLFQTVLEGLARDHGAEISIVVPREGPIVERVRKLGPVHIEEVPPSRGVLRRLRRGRARRRVRRLGRGEFDLVFANSVASLWSVEEMLADDPTPLVVYVHESRYLLDKDLPPAVRLLPRADLVFAVTPRVREFIESLVDPSTRIAVVPGFVPVRPTSPALPPDGGDAPAPGAGPRIIGGIGTICWHKGSDLFVVVARRVLELMPGQDLRFVWIGGEWRQEIRREMEHDVEGAGLTGVVSFPGRLDDPTDFLRSLSLFLLPSREDSWPLVMLEAAAEGVPIVCFRGAGGAEQFLAGGGGTAVPYLDVEAMSHAVVRYLTDPQTWARDSEIARAIAASPTPAEQIATIAGELADTWASRPGRRAGPAGVPGSAAGPG